MFLRKRGLIFHILFSSKSLIKYKPYEILIVIPSSISFSFRRAILGERNRGNRFSFRQDFDIPYGRLSDRQDKPTHTGGECRRMYNGRVKIKYRHYEYGLKGAVHSILSGKRVYQNRKALSDCHIERSEA